MEKRVRRKVMNRELKLTIEILGDNQKIDL
jgi:hypothetical protein